MTNNNTICALSTASGGAIGVIRISGPQSLEMLSRITTKDLRNEKPNTIHYTHIVDNKQGNIIDEVLVSVFRAPHSYTGEESAEISCHGSRYILNKVLELLVANGCRMAHPGEYTMRAFLNGKMDLSQAEAVADLIASTNQRTHMVAMGQLRGNFSSDLAKLRKELLKLTTLLELELDFSDHEDLEFADREELKTLAQHIDNHITTLAHSFETGQALKQGIPVAIIGKTNVGKSTLLNRLLKDDRAIVSDVHGTTRDTIEDSIDINGIPFRFIDTAGLRQTTDSVEQIGILRTYAAIEKAQIILWIFDETPNENDMKRIMERCEGKILLPIWNKTDKVLPPIQTIGQKSVIDISAKTGKNIDKLEQKILKAADIPEIKENDIILTNARHYDALTRAHSQLLRVIDGLYTDLSGDLLSEDLRLVIDTLAEITGGQITPQETLNNIFSHFCVGK
ncbi:MAG: tRNA uridine-5-carboxymethylaminomethyl(34) synthesis GTPase MnmE [Prevotella sp.]|nr:tRNA uridine-5-carboxymethylaminomethyl(34) synthesis GTPase MnmE [Prevotella sp.]